MASAREKNGKWYYRITTSSNGKTKYLERGSYNSRKEAIDAGNRHELRLKYGEVIFTKKRINYEDLVTEWLNCYAQAQYKLSTINTYKKVLKNYILPVLKDYDVSAISTLLLQDLINCEMSKHTLDGLYKIRSTLAKTFDYAIINGYILRNPVEGLKMPRKRSIMARSLKTTREQNTCPKSLISAIFERFPEGHPCHLPLLLGYRCGLRLGEAYGLLIDDYDSKNGTLTIRRQIQFNENNELYFTDPKYYDPGEYRVIDLDKDTCRVLNRHINKIIACRSVMKHKIYYLSKNNIVNENKDGEPIFFLNIRMDDGSYISPRTMQHVSRVIHGKESHFDYIDPTWDYHLLRHTHASECIAAGMPPESVKNRLGHRNLSTTYRFYVHETENQLNKAKKILEEMYA